MVDASAAPRRGVIRLCCTRLIVRENDAMPMRYDKGPWIARVVACVKERFEGEVGLEPTGE